MAEPKDCKVISPKDLEMFASEDATRQWYAAERFTMGVAIHSPGGGHVRHVHEDGEEMLYVIYGNGIVRFFPDESAHEAGPGDMVHIPAGVEHSVETVGWEPWKVICVYSPPGAEQYVMKGELIIPLGEFPEYKFSFEEGKYVRK